MQKVLRWTALFVECELILQRYYASSALVLAKSYMSAENIVSPGHKLKGQDVSQNAAHKLKGQDVLYLY